MSTAKELLNDLNLEKLVLWYHDLYKRYVSEQNEKGSYARFLSDLSEWYGKKLYLKKEDERTGLWIHLLWNLRHLRGALSPVESVERFLTYKEMIKTLGNLRDEGYEKLYPYDEKVALNSFSGVTFLKSSTFRVRSWSAPDLIADCAINAS